MNVTELRRVIAAELAEVNTCLPGVIVEYDGTFATVRPTLPKQLANGQQLPAPKIVRVPVCWPIADVNGAQALFTMPLKAGDPVMLNFSQRALDDWLGGSDNPPGDPRQFDLSDCFATPMVRPGTMVADTERVSMQYGPMTLKITPEGEVTLDTTANVTVNTTAQALVQAAMDTTIRSPLVTIDAVQTTTTGNLLVGGFLSMGTGGSGPGARAIIRGPVEIIDGPLYSDTQDIVSKGVVLATHVHTGVESGSELSGPPSTTP